MNEFIIGTSVGCTQTIIGYPFDTVKTWVQNKNSFKDFSIQNLYRGVKYPLMSSILINGFIFYSNNVLNNYFNNYFISGFYSGLFISPVINIFEVLKVKNQTNSKIKNLKSLVFKGISATSTRESIATSIYFGTYFELNKTCGSFTSGSIAGVSSWLLTYNLDVIKTRLQSDSCKTWKQAIKKGNLFNGLGICLLRAYIVNGFSFKLYDMIKNQ